MMQPSSPTSLRAASAGAHAATGARPTPNTDQAGGPLTDRPAAAKGFQIRGKKIQIPREGKSKKTEGNPKQAEGKSKACPAPFDARQWGRPMCLVTRQI